MSESLYLHGTAAKEQSRLAGLNQLLNQSSLRELQLPPGERVLEVGSGLGQFAREMARKTGPGLVIGIERSVQQIEEARRLAGAAKEEPLVEFRQGDALALPLHPDEWGTFDLVHARFLLEHVPRPLRAVQEMARAVRPGGRIVLEDDSHDILRLTPEPAGFSRLWEAYLRAYDRAGNDPLVGHRLVSLLARAGCRPTRNTWLFFGSCAGQPELFRACVENLLGIMSGVRSSLLDFDLLEAPTFDEAIAAIKGWSRRPDAALWYAISWAEGRKAADSADL